MEPSRKVFKKSGVKQGCTLAPSLFNLYMSNIALIFLDLNINPPRICNFRCPILMHADNLVHKQNWDSNDRYTQLKNKSKTMVWLLIRRRLRLLHLTKKKDLLQLEDQTNPNRKSGLFEFPVIWATVNMGACINGAGNMGAWR